MNRHLASLGAAGLVAAASIVLGAAPAPAAPTYQGRVVASGGVVQRTAPSTHVGTTGAGIRKGAVVTLDCQAQRHRGRRQPALVQDPRPRRLDRGPLRAEHRARAGRVHRWPVGLPGPDRGQHPPRPEHPRRADRLAAARRRGAQPLGDPAR
ncbi:hypothetical protein [Nocardioides convexus]|uniref:hypothetical protein n=1 Tax=Nocardioides convexus TaxID=2712224 RepID=UPI0024189D4C|nr:hypothetical protein [Nocardioides convexus]